MFFGDEALKLGWFYPELGRRQPACTALWSCSLADSTVISTHLLLASETVVPASNGTALA
jgi:hypothetical protein